MSTWLKLLISGIGLFFLFILFSYLVHKDLLTQFDFNTTVRLQDNISRRFDQPFSLLSDIGHFEIMTIVLVVFFVVIRKWFAGAVALFLYGSFHVIELFGKYFVDHPPPPHFMLRTQQIGDFPQFYVSTDFSYPSGHAGRTAFLSVAIIIFIVTNKRIPRIWKAGLCAIVLCYDLAMFISRPYLGEHWSSDVIGGVILGTGFGLITGACMITNPFKRLLSKTSTPQEKA